MEKKPYLLINNIHRKYIDLNRPIQLGTSNPKSETYWNNFHNKLNSIILECKERFGYCLVLDIHGNNKTDNFLQLGYGVKFKEIKRGVYEDFSLQHLKTKYSPLSLTNGNRSLGKFLDDYLVTIPSPRIYSKKQMKIITGNKEYYNGGFITQHYSKSLRIDVIQIELSRDLRENDILNYISDVISHGVVHFYCKNYKLKRI